MNHKDWYEQGSAKLLVVLAQCKSPCSSLPDVELPWSDPAESKWLQSPRSSHGVKRRSSTCSARCCRHCWIRTTLVNYSKSPQAPLLSDNLPSGYVVITAVSDVVLGMLGFPRHCLGLKTWKAQHWLIHFSVLCAAFQNSTDGEITLG